MTAGIDRGINSGASAVGLDRSPDADRGQRSAWPFNTLLPHRRWVDTL
jgi:hypothetical protein